MVSAKYRHAFSPFTADFRSPAATASLLFSAVARLARWIPLAGLATIFVDQGRKSAKLSLEVAYFSHKNSQRTTFDHSQIVPLIVAIAK
jgi:hypothetical protein